MKTILGAAGLNNSFQGPFPEEVKCVHCDGDSRVAFVAQEDGAPYLCDMYPNDPRGTGFWPHDACAVAVYFCKSCLQATALWNQA